MGRLLPTASQDTEAATRICAALRAAGAEVWFDQNELGGGDAWDAKIRRQIVACALFVPVISAATQARREGYFRIEWKLAAQRTHAMADGTPFLLPVVIDDTRDAEALVPGEFRAVQWTRLPGGEAAEKFCVRVKQLLGGEGIDVGSPPDRAHGHRRSLQPTRTPSRPWLAPAIVGLATVAALAVWQPWRSAKAPPPTAEKSAAPLPELARVRARIVPDRWQKGDFEAVSPALDRLIQASPDDADAWALRSITHTLQVLRLIDAGTKPLESGRSAAEHALRLAPEAPLVQLALGLHHIAMVSRGGDPRACRGFIDRAVAVLPADALTRFSELLSFYMGFDFENTARRAGAWLAAEPGATYPAWIMTSSSVVRRRPAEVVQWSRRSVDDPGITAVRTLMNLVDMHYYLRASLADSRATVERVPVGARGLGRVVTWRWQLAMAERQWDQALQELAAVPDAFIFDSSYNGPKAVLAGLAHQGAGRRDAAVVQFREAERLLRDKLAVDAENEALRVVLAVALAEAGRAPEARAELALVEPLIRGRAPNVYRARLVVGIAQAHGAMGDYPTMAFWLRKFFTEPSHVPLTPASLRLDPRFNASIDAPEIQALLREFASLDQPPAGAAK